MKFWLIKSTVGYQQLNWKNQGVFSFSGTLNLLTPLKHPTHTHRVFLSQQRNSSELAVETLPSSLLPSFPYLKKSYVLGNLGR